MDEADEPEPEPPVEVAIELPLLEAAAEVDDATAEEEVDSPDDALAEPQVTDKQAVWPVRSLGCAATQFVFHCAHTKEGMVWS